MKQFSAKILHHQKLLPNYYLLKLSWHCAIDDFKPGQFINVKVSDSTDPLLRRPFSIFNADDNSIDIVYKVVGKGTSILSSYKINDTLNIIGPLGKGIYFDDDALINKSSNSKPIVLIGGGTGCASVYFCAQHLFNKNIPFIAMLGFQSKKDAFCLSHWKNITENISENIAENLIISTNDGSLGHKGFITEKIDETCKSSSIIFACGPTPFLTALQKFCTSHLIKASFESTLACGTGMCSGCPIQIKINDTNTNVHKNNWVYKKICTDGPVFDLNTVILNTEPKTQSIRSRHFEICETNSHNDK